MKKYIVTERCLVHSWRGFRILGEGSVVYFACREGNTAYLRHTEDDQEEPFEARGWDALPIKAESELRPYERLKLGV